MTTLEQKRQARLIRDLARDELKRAQWFNDSPTLIEEAQERLLNAEQAYYQQEGELA